jgi:hypothetical protein
MAIFAYFSMTCRLAVGVSLQDAPFALTRA